MGCGGGDRISCLSSSGSGGVPLKRSPALWLGSDGFSPEGMLLHWNAWAVPTQTSPSADLETGLATASLCFLRPLPRRRWQQSGALTPEGLPEGLLKLRERNLVLTLPKLSPPPPPAL